MFWRYGTCFHLPSTWSLSICMIWHNIGLKSLYLPQIASLSSKPSPQSSSPSQVHCFDMHLFAEQANWFQEQDESRNDTSHCICLVHNSTVFPSLRLSHCSFLPSLLKHSEYAPNLDIQDVTSLRVCILQYFYKNKCIKSKTFKTLKTFEILIFLNTLPVGEDKHFQNIGLVCVFHADTIIAVNCSVWVVGQIQHSPKFPAQPFPWFRCI